MSDAADAAAARKEKERLLRERRRQRILAGSSSRLSLITGATSAKGEQPAEDNPPEVAQEQQGETASPNGSNTIDGGEAQREEGATNPPPATAASPPEPAVTLTQRRTTRRSEEAEVVPTRREEDGHGTYTGTLTFEEGVELPSPSSLLSQAASGAEFAATVLPHLAKMTTGASTSAAPKVRPSLARASGVVSIVVLAIVLGCAFFFADIPVMQDNVLVRLLASDEPEAWLNVRSSSVMVPFFTLEAALILVSILSSRFLAPRQQEPSAAGMWFFSLPFGRVFADMSLFLFSFIMSIDLLSLAWPWIAATTAPATSSA